MNSSSSRRVLWTVVLVLLVALGIGAYLVLSKKPPAPEPAKPAPVAEVPPAEKEETIGKSVQGRAIDAYTYGTGPTHLLFVGGIHGGYEWNSAALAYRFMDYLKEDPAHVPAQFTVTVIPSANPDGLYKVIGKEGQFSLADAPTKDDETGRGRLNAHNVDLNRNFDCKWQATSTWRNTPVGAGTSAFSEPETAAIRDYVSKFKPAAAVFWHSQSNAVYASECKNGVLPETLDIMNAYSKASKYPAVKSFTAYPVSGDAEGWLASIGIPAITVELESHTAVSWDRNLAGIQALFDYFSK